MVGADELDLVRIVEMEDRKAGSKVHTRLAVDDPRSIYPLQAARGYDLAQSMFTHQRNLVVEGVTDLLYIEALDKAFTDEAGASLADGTAIVPAGSASKVVYYSTILTRQSPKVAALLDSDAAGDLAAEQEELWQLLTSKRILRTGDHISGVERAEIEDLLRTTDRGSAPAVWTGRSARHSATGSRYGRRLGGCDVCYAVPGCRLFHSRYCARMQFPHGR